MAAHKRFRSRDDDRAPVRRPQDVGPQTEEAAPATPRIGGHEVLQLQRTAGNLAVARLLQREQGPAEEATGPEAIGSPLPLQLRELALGMIEFGRRHNQPNVVQIGRTFLQTGRLALLSNRAGVMEQPRFLGRRLALLRRGMPVTVLDKRGAWMLVLTEGGETGWMHESHLIPRLVALRPGETGSGSTRGEAEIGGRG